MSPAMRHSAAVGAKTARACDGCLRRRARWFCEADEAFLCQSCDVSVHSANPLARRHQRVRLNTASSLEPPSSPPAWLHGFTRKPRTPRGKPLGISKAEPLVPDLEAMAVADEEELDEQQQQQQLLYCVPILDPVIDELCLHPLFADDANASGEEVKPAPEATGELCLPGSSSDAFAGLHPSEMDLAEFASDMETLLGRGLGDDCFSMAELGLLGEDEEGRRKVKEEMELDGGDAACDYRVDAELGSAAMVAEVEEEIPLENPRINLRLDYEAVVVAWSSNGCSPWMDGGRPELDPKRLLWPELHMTAGDGGSAEVTYYPLGVAAAVMVDEGREARVSRYREKRRTRLFSKKIRYEVRKLNAEKRPRMKGRFVKRASAFPATGAPAVSLFYR
ncbi:zinc finger protein CONSTANS-LIKE 16-like [Zingiber officinale]|uniref:Uncharacterized protein n=1 Tax=Zingiber officinale TaxID=94328 RepID=A0A8J5I1G4_ZINOF|nr:zinc finger protein CONSTANS-LIKE 16-like [Zingiber officinale]KAG6526278.1 hypothetical protein ZIOFF_016260 [Zingiber officinale]